MEAHAARKSLASLVKRNLLSRSLAESGELDPPDGSAAEFESPKPRGASPDCAPPATNRLLVIGGFNLWLDRMGHGHQNMGYRSGYSYREIRCPLKLASHLILLSLN